eukprot:CAMPEP_0117520350 /NCGR_PEP_ID=MMETSP0784-20121206/33124_1 /TAXON_ID=39447 /ORGANISM="" /LENGTH=46 /DNA_ID= /DNA_START= /DNA_END= /DNA_ORIENTATION=
MSAVVYTSLHLESATIDQRWWNDNRLMTADMRIGAAGHAESATSDR